MLKIKNVLLTVLFSFFIISCEEDKKSYSNVILMIGDGMGSEHRKAASLLKYGDDKALYMDHLFYDGYIKTKSNNSDITDSAAAATAISTGIKTNNGFVGVTPELSSLVNILEIAKQRGMKVGIVSNTQITHATPASFYSHVQDRYMNLEIAEQIFNTDIDVILGGGERDFTPNTEIGCYESLGSRTDERNLIEEALLKGYSYVCDAVSFELLDVVDNQKVLGLFADEGMNRPHNPSLKAMTKKAIDILSMSERGFFLLVEGGQIDWASHQNKSELMMSDVLEFDEAVAVSTVFTETNSNTLLIVTADHETGGLLVTEDISNAPTYDGPYYQPNGLSFFIKWTTTNHTGVDVPINATGKNSLLLDGVHENTFVFDVMKKTIEE